MNFIIGCGYVGLQVAEKLLKQNQSVAALTHSEQNQARLQMAQVQTYVADLDQVETLGNLPSQVDTLFYFAPPSAQGICDTRISHFLSQFTAKPKKAILISTTGVYGDCQGAWIDETRGLNPQTDRAKRRADAEQQWQQWAEQQQIDWVILRVAGIYGAQRLPIARLKHGLSVLDEAIAPYSNRVHVDDLVNACIAASQAGQGIFNITDGNPTTMTDYFNQVAIAMNLPLPSTLSREQAEQQLSPEMNSYLAESKRIDNQKMQQVLQVIPKYSTLQQGLAAIMNFSLL
ncbi:NAD-dependent epimerase/dehydratase family protein [Candidatus Albibeggiatoa sp. nov. BB20]|uniref:NAD-dependent epimerase/dehydratase family protein n=1 Tax=Candidatus Albibeggiatoa sp. nov. BB20 TaxID=3162723 RepID=UPI0033659832